MERLEQLWAVWRHGALLSIVYAVGLGVALLLFSIAAWALNAAFGAVGRGMEEDALFRLVLALFPVWVPLGVGMAARYSSSDKFKPEGYPEHVG